MASGGQLVKSQTFQVPPSAPAYLAGAVRDIGKDEVKYRKYFNDRIKDKLGVEFDVKLDPWCAEWIGVELEDAGYQSTKKANARSYLAWGVAVEQNDWQVGDIVVFWRGTRDDGWSGHVAFLLNWDDESVYCLGGNQGDKVCIQRFSKAKILGIRRFRSAWSTRTVKAGATKVAIGGGVIAKGAIDAVPIDTAVQTQDLLHQAMSYLPNMTEMLGIAAVLVGAYVIYRRVMDMKETGR